mgnify:CR=1 FL=1
MWNVIRYEQVASTNEVCRQLAVRGADDTAVTARVQTAGKGRLGRSFQSPEGGLYLSALWRSCGGAELLRVTPMAAVAVCRAVERLCGAQCGIKWCNDVVLAGRKLCGILNGIDTVGYNPSRDHALAANFSARKPEGKALCKAALQQQMHLPEEPDTPILAMVSRLVSHKGFDLVEYAMENMLRMGMQVVILGNGEYRYEEFFREMQRRHPQQVAFTCGFMPTLSRQIYAGADFFLMPSQSEPCGLAQMIALRYGTGGLADSIIDWDTPGGGCGFTFQSYNADDMLGAVRRAMGLYHSEYRAEMLPRALRCDFSWRRSAKQYMSMYLGI